MLNASLCVCVFMDTHSTLQSGWNHSTIIPHTDNPEASSLRAFRKRRTACYRRSFKRSYGPQVSSRVRNASLAIRLWLPSSTCLRAHRVATKHWQQHGHALSYDLLHLQSGPVAFCFPFQGRRNVSHPETELLLLGKGLHSAVFSDQEWPYRCFLLPQNVDDQW